MPHRFDLRVYYEDTDFGGIVYYANYLKFIERARSEWVRDIGMSQIELKEQGIVFAVRHLDADYHLAANYDDELTVLTELTEVTGARFLMDQKIWRGETLIFSATVTIVCISNSGRPTRLPAEIRREFAQ